MYRSHCLATVSLGLGTTYICLLSAFVSFFSTFVCPTEIIAFSDRVEEFRAINCEVIACSVDSHFSHLAW